MDDEKRQWLAKACDILSRTVTCENFALEGAMKTLAEFLRSDACPRSGDVLFRRVRESCHIEVGEYESTEIGMLLITDAVNPGPTPASVYRRIDIKEPDNG